MIWLLAVATVYLLVSSYQDFRTREVDDKLSDSFIILAILIQASTLLSGNFEPFLWALAVGLGLFVFGWIMYQTGQWGGADVKILTALAILFANVKGFMFKTFKRNVKKDQKELYKIIGAFMFALLLISGVLYFRYIVTPLELLGLMLPLLWLLAILPLFWLLLKFTQVIEQVCFRIPAKAKTLREFDLLTESLVRVRGKILRIPEGEKLKGKTIVDCKDPNGLTPKQIEQITKLVKEKKLKDAFIIKWGLPFVPVFLIALYFTLWAGNGLFWIFGL